MNDGQLRMSTTSLPSSNHKSVHLSAVKYRQALLLPIEVLRACSYSSDSIRSW